jgi:hypothetical protein
MADLYAAGNAYAPNYSAGNAYAPSYNNTTYKQTAYQAPAPAPQPAPKPTAQPAAVAAPQAPKPQKQNLFAAPNQFQAAPGQYAAPNQFGAGGAYSPFNMAQAQQRVNAWRARAAPGVPRQRPGGLLASGMRVGGALF